MNTPPLKSTGGFTFIMILCALLLGAFNIGRLWLSDGEKETPVIIEGRKKIHINSEDMLEIKQLGEWIFFRYYIDKKDSEDYTDLPHYPVLLKYKKTGKNAYIAEKVSEKACYVYDISGDRVYYADYPLGILRRHGELFSCDAEGKDKRLLEKELYTFQIIDEKYIYYTYSYDTIGVGLGGRAVHRMNLDGTDKMIAAYEIDSPGYSFSSSSYIVKDGWADNKYFQIGLGGPASGLEKVVFNNVDKDQWIYYTSNRLIKARADGSEQIELDGPTEFFYTIDRVEDGWVYYTKDNNNYKIRTDGSEKTKIPGE